MAQLAESERVINTIRMQAPGLLDPAIHLELFNTIDEFCQKTNAWRYDATTELAAGVVKYPLSVPGNTQLVRVLAASHDGRPVASFSAPAGADTFLQTGLIRSDIQFPDDDSTFNADATDAGGGPVVAYSIYYPEYITISIPPSAEATQKPFLLTLALTLKSEVLADPPDEWGVCEWMWDRYATEWTEGTLARLHKQKAKPYSDEKMAIYYAKRFRAHLAFCRYEASKGLIYQPLAPTYPRNGWV